MFTLPFWLTLIYVKKYPTGSICKYVVLDAASNILPAFFAILLSEVIMAVTVEKTAVHGMITLIFLVLFLLVALLFWLLYFVFSKIKYKNRP
jgi:hypothetical protein